MAQTYQMKHNPQGTIYSLLTVESDGQMTMTFHGTDREICHEVTENADGWLCYPGGMFPGLASGKWQLMADGRCMMDDVRCMMDDVRCMMADEPFLRPDSSKRPKAERTMNPEPLTINQPRPRRQRKPRKPRVDHQEPITVNPEPLTVNHQSSSTLKAVGMVAAATVALFVIYETGLLIPLGLIGLATGGLLK